MKGSVLITGASGFLGYHLVTAALNEGYKVYAAVRKSSRVEHLANLPVSFVDVDYSDPVQTKQQLEEWKIDYVLHAAGTTKALTQADYDKVNDTYTFHLATAAAQSSQPVKRFVFISSLAAAGPSDSLDQMIREDAPPRPVTAYGKSKLKAEEHLKSIDIPVTVLRPTAIYGPREKDIFIVTQYLNKGFDPYIGRFSQKLSFVYAKDMAAVAVRALEKDTASGVYHISDGREYSRYAYADIVTGILGKKAKRFHIPLPLIRVIIWCSDRINGALKKVSPVNVEKLNELTAPNWACDISRAEQDLDFKPQYDLQKGLEESVEWYRKNKWLK